MDHPAETEAGTTRDRILEAALDLFTEQGFDKTSLRKIAEQVGVTKAALYYHFRSKEELLSSLVAGAHGVGHHGLEMLPTGEGPVDRAAAAKSLELFLDLVLAQRRVFVLMERNRTAIDALSQADPTHQDEHRQLEERWVKFMANSKVSLRDRVRITAALGAVMATAIGTSRGLGAETPEGLRDELVAVIRDLLGVTAPP